MNLSVLNKNFQYHEKEKIVVIWQAKCGCTMVNKAYYYHEGLLDKALEFNPFVHYYRIHIEPNRKMIKNKALSDNKVRYIQFIRNPFSRAVSSYLHLCKTGYLKRMKEFTPLNI